ncbi:MAG: lipid A biosynthesis protein [Bacteroidia bacterium]
MIKFNRIIKYFPFYVLSLLPLPILYLFSNVLMFLLYYVFGYRKQVVRQNLQKSFPEKSLKEIIQIEKKFYLHLTDIIVETIKLLTISPRELNKRCIYTQSFQKIFNQYYSERKDVVVLMGHLGNWEWAGACFNLNFPHPLYVLYHPLSNRYFDELMKIIRTRFGTCLIPMQTAFKHILKNTNQSAVFTFIADQCPSPQNAFWMNFLNQDTPVYYGPEVITKKLHCPVMLVSMKKIKRGYYEVDTLDIENVYTDEVNYPVMHSFMNYLEREIKEQPEIWLWSHRRWKHQRKNKI